MPPSNRGQSPNSRSIGCCLVLEVSNLNLDRQGYQKMNLNGFATNSTSSRYLSDCSLKSFRRHSSNFIAWYGNLSRTCPTQIHYINSKKYLGINNYSSRRVKSLIPWLCNSREGNRTLEVSWVFYISASLGDLVIIHTMKNDEWRNITLFYEIILTLIKEWESTWSSPFLALSPTSYLHPIIVDLHLHIRYMTTIPSTLTFKNLFIWSHIMLIE